MKKILYSTCESDSQKLQTSPFVPVDFIKDYITIINQLYDGIEDLLRLEEEGDKVKVHASTYLLGANLENEANAKDEIISALNGLNVPEDLRKILVDNDWSCNLPVGEVLPILISNGQSVLIQITDPVYGDSEFTVER